MGRIAFLVLSLLAGAAHAELYKWVDERGVVNYSNAPPADAKQAKVAQHVEERVSVYQPDALTKAAQATRGPSYYEQQLEREWMQRQRLMASTNASSKPICASSFSTDCYYEDPRFAGYATPYGPAVIVARPAQVRPTRLIGSRPLLLR